MQLEKVLRSRIFWIFTPILIWSLFSWLGLSMRSSNFNIEVFGVVIVYGILLIPTTFFWGINSIDSFFQEIIGPVLALLLILWAVLFYGLYLYFILKLKKLEMNKILIIGVIVLLWILISIIFMITNPPSF